MRLLWATDIHLDHIRVPGAGRLLGGYLCKEQTFDAVLLTGDISVSDQLEAHLEGFALAVACPVYFVLGNHDYYHSSTGHVRKLMADLTARIDNLIWLDAEPEPTLFGDTALVGQEGWCDARTGLPEGDSRFAMRDWNAIEDLTVLTLYEIEMGIRQPLIEICQKWADAQARDAKLKLEAALKLRKDVIFATHYPPFPQASWHKGRMSDNIWRPWFTSVAMGEMLAEVAEAHPDSRITVLCGHTHSGGVYKHFENLVVRTGKAVYGIPDVEDVFELPISWVDDGDQST